MHTISTYGAQFELLDELEPVVASLMARHREKPELWFPSDLMPAGTDEERDEETRGLRERAKTLPDAVRVVLDLNIRTEEGLPHFHRLIAGVAKPNSSLGQWNNLWTGEEDRHGCVLRDYIRDARLMNLRAVEVRQYEYLCAGFNPQWANGSPYELLVYTTLQEKATQLSHQQTANVAGDYEPLLQQILGKVAADEAWHYAFYLGLVKAIMERDPDGALAAAIKILPHIDMPGLSMRNFKEYAEVAARLGIYALRNYQEIVQNVIRYWGVATLQHLKAASAKAQEDIMSLPKRLERLADRTEARLTTKTFSFDVVDGRSFEI